MLLQQAASSNTQFGLPMRLRVNERESSPRITCSFALCWACRAINNSRAAIETDKKPSWFLVDDRAKAKIKCRQKNVHTKMRMVFPSRLVVSTTGLQTVRYERNGTEQWIVTHVPIRHIAHRTSHMALALALWTWNHHFYVQFRAEIQI